MLIFGVTLLYQQTHHRLRYKTVLWSMWITPKNVKQQRK